MSFINVWTSDGDWSNGVDGCDKIHLMKRAIIVEYQIAGERCKGNFEEWVDIYEPGDVYIDGTITQKRIHESGLQIDNKAINLKYLVSEYRVFREFREIDFKKIDLKSASFFKVHLSTLRTMAEQEKTMSAVYNELIEQAKVPEKAPKSFFLLFMFSEE